MDNIKKSDFTYEELKVLKVFESVIPILSPIERARLLGIGEGLAMKTQRQKMQTRGAEKNSASSNVAS